MGRELTMSSTFSQELFGLAKGEMASILNKIDSLLEDPNPNGGSKKKLSGKEFKDVYRLRLGDRRIFYTFGDTWVKVLTIRKRNEKTYNSGLDAETPVSIDESGEIDVAVLGQAGRQHQFNFSTHAAPTLSRPLPRDLTPEWLAEVAVPSAHFSKLVACKTEDDLLEVTVPDSVISRLLDILFPPTLEEVMSQPELVVKDVKDLVRYREGTLIALLLKLDDEQRALTDWALKGPTMIKGGAGTGKSTVALYRVKAMLENVTATGRETALFTTYTRALTRASSQLLDQLLDNKQRKRVRVSTCDNVALEIVRSRKDINQVVSSNRLRRVLRDLRKDFDPGGQNAFERAMRKRWLAALSDRYILEEFHWIIEGRGIDDLDEYLTARRPGRGFPMKEGQRKALWTLREAFQEELRKKNLVTWSAIRQEALEMVQDGSWDHRFDVVLVDEAQDLTPVALALMAELAKSPKGLFFAADSKQSLYSRNYGWTSAHPKLRFRGRSRNLKRNYRSTGEVDRAAFDVLTAEQGEELERSISFRSGPLPVLLKGVSPEHEGQWAARFVKQMAQHLRVKTSTAAILTPTSEAGQQIATELCQLGLPARFHSSEELDLTADGVKLMTLHAAKGLEFPLVVLCGFGPGTYPESSNFRDQDVYAERLRGARRILYVGMSRAMSGLMVIVQEGCEHEALDSLSSEHWVIEEVE